MHIINLLSQCAKEISTSNHMLGRAILNKLPECIFENFEIARVKRGHFQVFRSHEYPKNCPKQTCAYWLITPNQQKLFIENDIF